MEVDLEFGNGYELENLEAHDRKVLDCLIQIFCKNMNAEGVSSESSEGLGDMLKTRKEGNGNKEL